MRGLPVKTTSFLAKAAVDSNSRKEVPEFPK
jgi:hypothetical protein